MELGSDMKQWHALDINEVKAALEAAPKNYGPNRLDDKEGRRWHVILLRQFQSPLVFILAVAAGLSFFLADLIDAIAILAIIILNGMLGFVQEWKAETALAGLKKMLAPHCRVIRDGKEREISAEELIPGDCVLLTAGNAVPADIRLVAETNLGTDEAALTGESVLVNKSCDALPEGTPLTDRRNMVWMGTHIVNGRGEGLVVATGMDTEFGRIAGLTGDIQETPTRLQKHLAILARQLGVLALLAAGSVIAIGVLGGKSAFGMLMTGISLAVAAVPEGLPAVVTITLALGVRAMARKKALLRRLQAAETLGAVSVICTDKTGTLTKNEMTVQKIWMSNGKIDVSGVGYEPKGGFSREGGVIEPPLDAGLMMFLDTGRKCNHAKIEKERGEWRVIGSPTEAALLTAAEKAGLQHWGGSMAAEHSFNSQRKRMSIVEQRAGDKAAHVKGAPEVLLPLCTHLLVDGTAQEMTPDMKKDITFAYEGFAREGLRTLALARKTMTNDDPLDQENVENGLTFLGIAGVIDPPRNEVQEALKLTKSAGIKVIIITGDSPDTAQAVARQIGLQVERAVTGADLAAMGDEEISLLMTKDILFARTVPEDKFRIVKILQEQNKLVAMTGDGVNDAPALKQADIGIAMGIRGTDVAKGVADIVLLDDNFASIVSAIREGRRQYANIRKFVSYLTSSNIGETLAIFGNIIIGGPLILLPIQILWVNLITDSVTALSLSVEKEERGAMQEPPRSVKQAILGKRDIIMLGLDGSYIGLGTLVLFHVYLQGDHSALANTVAFTAMVMMANIHTLNFRNLQGPIKEIGWLSNPWLLAAVIFMTLLQAIVIYVPGMDKILRTAPLALRDWMIIILTVLPLFIMPEIYKIWRRRP